MSFEVEKFSFKSSNEVYNVYGKIITPVNKNIKGIVQICHGMCEYFDKYEVFAEYLANAGYIVCGHDQIGHGDSVDKKENLGYFSPKDGYKFLIKDVKNVNDIIRNRYKTLPLFLLGHSMGSLILRCYIAKYGREVDGVILCGSVGPQHLTKAAIKLAKFMAESKGDHYRSKKLYNIALDFANIKFLPVHTRYDWVSSDEEEVKRHVTDEKSDFIFTVSAFADLFHLVNLCNSDMVIKTIPKDLPIIFMSGKQDPLGEYGEGVKKAVNLYKNWGIESVDFKLYENARHELIREKNKDEIYEDILNWINKHNLKMNDYRLNL